MTVEKVAIPDAAVEAGLVALYGGHWPRSFELIDRPTQITRMRSVIQAALAAMGEAEPVVSGLSDYPLPENPTLPPMTDRGLAGQVMDLAWSHYLGNNMPADFWRVFAEGVRFTLHVAHPPRREAVEEAVKPINVAEGALEALRQVEQLACYDGETEPTEPTVRQIWTLVRAALAELEPAMSDEEDGRVG